MSHITTAPEFDRRDLVIDGKKWQADFGDLVMLERAAAIADMLTAMDSSKPTAELMGALRDMTEEAVAIIENVLGEGACDKLFGPGRRPVMRLMATVMQLAKVAGDAQAAAFKQFQAKYVE